MFILTRRRSFVSGLMSTFYVLHIENFVFQSWQELWSGKWNGKYQRKPTSVWEKWVEGVEMLIGDNN